MRLRRARTTRATTTRVTTARVTTARAATTRATATAAAVGLILTSALAGCALISADAATSSAAACTTPGVTPQQVKLGLIYPNSGTSAAIFDNYRAGVDARLGVANAAGGVYGRKITYDWGDDTTDQTMNLTVAKNLVGADGVFGILEGTTVGTGSAQYLHDSGVPVVGTADELVWSRYDNMFAYSMFITPGPTSVSTWGQYVRAQGGTRAAVMFSSFNETSAAFRDKFVTSLRAAGVDVVTTIDAEPASVDDRAIAAQLKADNIDTLVGATDPTMFITAAASAQFAGAHLKVVLTPTGYDPRVLASPAAPLLGGILSVFLPGVPFEKNPPILRSYLAAMTEYAPQVLRPTGEIAMEGYLSADLMLAGLKAAGPCPTRAGLISALRNVTNYDADGEMLAPVDLRKVFGVLGSCYAFTRLNAHGTGWDVVAPYPNCGHPVN